MGNSSNTLKDKQKNILKEELIIGARNYKKYLTDKVFLIICEDGSEYEIRFHKKDFNHLTGVCSNLNEGEFFEYCLKALIDIGNINSIQKYNWSTLKKKGIIIQNIHELLYKDNQKTLLLEALETNTYVFPIAIRDDANDVCVGFVSELYKARSLRRAKNSIKAKAEKRIIAIFARRNELSLYTEQINISTVKGIYSQNEKLLEKLDEPIMIRFLEILTKPD